MRDTSSHFALMRRFQADERAVSAVEFALIMPLLIFLLFASFDVTRAVDAKTKTSVLAGAISDIVTQYPTGVNQTDLANIVKASKFILYPYSDAKELLTVSIESINQTKAPPNPEYEIDWSYLVGTSTTANKTNRVTTKGSDVTQIITDVTYTYKLKFVGYLTKRLGFSELSMKSTMSSAPRFGNAIPANW